MRNTVLTRRLTRCYCNPHCDSYDTETYQWTSTSQSPCYLLQSSLPWTSPLMTMNTECFVELQSRHIVLQSSFSHQKELIWKQNLSHMFQKSSSYQAYKTIPESWHINLLYPEERDREQLWSTKTQSWQHIGCNPGSVVQGISLCLPKTTPRMLTLKPHRIGLGKIQHCETSTSTKTDDSDTVMVEGQSNDEI